MFTHTRGWCDSHDDLAKLKYPMARRHHAPTVRDYGVLKDDAGIAYRGIFLIDPNGVVRWSAVHDLSVGRNVDEVLRVLDALQTGQALSLQLNKGDETLN